LIVLPNASVLAGIARARYGNHPQRRKTMAGAATGGERGGILPRATLASEGL
jgi:hypothetical protein